MPGACACAWTMRSGLDDVAARLAAIAGWSMIGVPATGTACTYRLDTVMTVPVIGAIPPLFVYVALAAWTLTFAGLLATLAQRFRTTAR